MLRNKDTAATALPPKMALKMALASSPIATLAIAANSILAQSPSPEPAFPMPKNVPSGSTVRIDGSESMTVINRNLKQGYEQKYSGTKVELEESGSQSALSALLDGKIDLAAIGRALSSEEKQQGFTQVPISREKIAILIGPENPFTGNITYVQFAKIFRGEITDWSELGGPPGKIRLVDRPESSDTRQAFRNYDIFKETEFKTGENVTAVAQDSTADSIKELGKDGISYAIYSQVKDLSEKDVRIVSMHKTLPEDPRYPFSQPRVYVYKDAPNEATQAFLAYATNPEGQAVVEEAKEEEAQAIDSELAASPNSQTGTDATETDSVTGANPDDTALNPTTGVGTPAPVGTLPPGDGIDPSLLGLLLLPILAVLGLLWWGVRKQQAERQARLDRLSSTSPPTLETTIPDAAVTGTPTLPQGTAPDVTGLQTPSLPDANVPDVTVPDASLPDASLPDADATEDLQPPSSGVSWGQVGGLAAAGAGAAALGAALAGTDDEPEDSVELPTPELEGSLPDASVPDVSLPDVSLPDVSLPDVSLTDVSVPDVNLPDASLPDVSIPDVNLPDVSVPDVDATLDVEQPSGGVSWGQVGGLAAAGAGAAALGAALAGTDEEPEDSVELPTPELEGSLPDVSIPDVSLPDAGLPDVSVPDVNLPDASLPDVSIPDVNLPDASLPDVSLPDVSVPDVDAASDVEPPSGGVSWGQVGGLAAAGAGAAALGAALAGTGSEEEEPDAPEELEGEPTRASLPDVEAIESTETAGDTPEVDVSLTSPSLEISPIASDSVPSIGLGELPEDEGAGWGDGLIAAGGLAAGVGMASPIAGGGDEPEAPAVPSLLDVEMPPDEISGTVPDVAIPPAVDEPVDNTRGEPRWEGGLWTTGRSPVEEPIEEPSIEEPSIDEPTRASLPDVAVPEEATLDTPELDAPELDRSTASEENPPIALIDSEAEETPDIGSELLAAGGVAAGVGLGAVLLGGEEEPETDDPASDSSSETTAAPNPLELSDPPSDSTPPSLLLGLTDAQDDTDTDTDAATDASTAVDEDAGISEALGEMTPEPSSDSTETIESPTEPTNEPGTGGLGIVTPVPIVPPIGGIEAGAGAALAAAGVAAVGAALPVPDTEPATAGTETAPEAPPDPGLTLAGGAAAAAGSALWSAPLDEDSQTSVEAAKFDVGQADLSSEALASVDEGLAELPEGYGESRIVLLPRDPHWAYAYWDIANAQKEEARRQGGTQLALRFYDVTDIDMEQQIPHSLQQYTCDEMARDWYLSVPMSDRDYVVEIGYFSNDARWLMLARSAPVRVPPLYPSDWDSDRFVNIGWNEMLSGTALVDLGSPPARGTAAAGLGPLVGLSPLAEAQRVSGSIFGSMQQAPLSSYVYPSGMGMSGVGFSASMPPIKPSKFWLVADAELIVYGATDPTASLTIGGEPVSLNPDGTFRIHVSFPDGVLDYPIWAVSADGEHSRSIHMQFTRETLRRNTNTAQEAQEQWPVE